MAAQRDRTLHLAVDLQVFGAGDMTLDLQARTEPRRIACRGTARASARGCAKRCCRGRGFRRRRYGRWFGLRWAWRGNHEKGVACADQTLSVRTGQALQASSDLLNSIEEADQVFPGEVVDEQRDGCGDREGVRGEAGNGEAQKTRDNDTERREQNGQESAVEADGELQARAQRHEENIPKAPGVGHYGHGEHDHALDGNGDVVDITGGREDSRDDEEKNRGDNYACHVRAKINVLIHKASSFTGDTATPG